MALYESIQSAKQVSPMGFSLHIGVDCVDPTRYSKSPKKLRSPSRNTEEYAKLFLSTPFTQKSISTITNERAKRANILGHLKAIAEQCKARDFVFITFSGHGGQIEDQDGIEYDGLDETWGCYDGEIVDDELCRAWSVFPSGVTIFVLSDSCHSGSILKGIRKSSGHFGDSLEQRIIDEKIKAARNGQGIFECEGREEVQASVISISAVKDHQFAQDGQSVSKFTKAVLDVWEGGKFAGTFNDFFVRLKKHENASAMRNPQLNEIGRGAKRNQLSKQKMFNPLTTD